MAQKSPSPLNIVLGFGSLLLLVLGLVAVYFLTGNSVDLRNQASIDGGLVKIMTSNTPTTAVVGSGEPVLIDVSFTTSGANIDSLQLVGKATGTSIQNPVFTPNPELNLVGLTPSIIDVSETEFRLVFTLADVKTPVNVSGDFSLGILSFVPVELGNLQVVWDSQESKSSLYAQATDTLDSNLPITNIGLVMPKGTVASPSPVPCQYDQYGDAVCPDLLKICKPPSEFSAGPIDNCGCETGSCVYPSPVPSSSVIPTPTPSPGVGGGCEYDEFNSPICPPVAQPVCAQGTVFVQPANDICGCEQSGQCVAGPSPSLGPTSVPVPSPVPSPLSSPVLSTPTPLPTVFITPAPSPSPSPVVTCQYSYSDWSACKNGFRNRTILSSTAVLCEGEPDVLVEACGGVITCTSDDQCPSDEYCYQPPMPICPQDVACAQVMPASYCQIKGEIVDLNQDGYVNLLDVSILISSMRNQDLTGDINGDGYTDIFDYSEMVIYLTSQPLILPTATPVPSPVSSPVSTPTPPPVPTPTPSPVVVNSPSPSPSSRTSSYSSPSPYTYSSPSPYRYTSPSGYTYTR